MSKKQTEQPSVFEATIFVIGTRIKSGNTYPQEVADKIILDVVTGEKKYTIEEVAPADRSKNGVMPYESWPQRAMAKAIDAKMVGNRLVMTFQIYKNKYGKNLSLLLENNPPGSIEFYPVGIGSPDESGVVANYSLSYVSFELKNKEELK